MAVRVWIYWLIIIVHAPPVSQEKTAVKVGYSFILKINDTYEKKNFCMAITLSLFRLGWDSWGFFAFCSKKKIWLGDTFNDLKR